MERRTCYTNAIVFILIGILTFVHVAALANTEKSQIAKVIEENYFNPFYVKYNSEAINKAFVPTFKMSFSDNGKLSELGVKAIHTYLKKNKKDRKENRYSFEIQSILVHDNLAEVRLLIKKNLAKTYLDVFSLIKLRSGWKIVSKSFSRLARGKVLILMSDKNKLSLRGNKKTAVGYYLNEFIVPVNKLLDNGFEIDIVTIGGGRPVLDKLSDDKKYFSDMYEYTYMKNLNHKIFDSEFVDKVSLSLSSLSKYSGLLVPGGHAPLVDLYKSKEVVEILRYFHLRKLPTGLICHGPVALLGSLKEGYYQGYEMTVFSDKEEKIAEKYLGGTLQFYAEEELRKNGAKVSIGPMWKSKVIRYKELITAQNPFSVDEFSKYFLESLTQ